MGSIPKIVSTPLKWVSKQVLNRTLLRFKGGDPHDPIVCTYCPEMCRFSCPTAVASGNDAVTPLNKNALLHKEREWPGRTAAGGQLWSLYDCTGCGRCTNYCIYGMPVADHLFKARESFKWDVATQAASGLSDAEDPVGDLAAELGDLTTARRRLSAHAAAVVDEPRSLQFMQAEGRAASLSWERALLQPTAAHWSTLRTALGAKRWLVHESVWLNRRLGRHEQATSWIGAARAAGLELVVPFHSDRDCIDCGGETGYPRLFADQAATIALEFWQRDQSRADGILCFSARCTSHFRQTLGSEISVVCWPELLRGDCL